MAATVFGFGPRLQPLFLRQHVFPEFVLQPGFRELECTTFVDMRVVRPIHSGHGQDVDAGRVAILPCGETAYKVCRITDFYGRATQPARLDRVEAAFIAAWLRHTEADKIGERRHALCGSFLFVRADVAQDFPK